MRTLTGILLVASAVGCSNKQPGASSRLTIQIPQAATKASEEKVISASAVSWSLACYSVNVTASDIPASQPDVCDIPFGRFSGFVASGGELALEVPRGDRRRLDILIYQRSSSSEPCPVRFDGFGTLNRSKIVRVGTVPSFDANSAEVTVPVTLAQPAAGETLTTQYQLPASCVSSPAPPVTAPNTPRVANGHAVVSGGGYVVDGTIGQSAEIRLTSGSYQIRMSRKEQ